MGIKNSAPINKITPEQNSAPSTSKETEETILRALSIVPNEGNGFLKQETEEEDQGMRLMKLTGLKDVDPNTYKYSEPTRNRAPTHKSAPEHNSTPIQNSSEHVSPTKTQVAERGLSIFPDKGNDLSKKETDEEDQGMRLMKLTELKDVDRTLISIDIFPK